MPQKKQNAKQESIFTELKSTEEDINERTSSLVEVYLKTISEEIPNTLEWIDHLYWSDNYIKRLEIQANLLEKAAFAPDGITSEYDWNIDKLFGILNNPELINRILLGADISSEFTDDTETNKILTAIQQIAQKIREANETVGENQPTEIMLFYEKIQDIVSEVNQIRSFDRHEAFHLLRLSGFVGAIHMIKEEITQLVQENNLKINELEKFLSDMTQKEETPFSSAASVEEEEEEMGEASPTEPLSEAEKERILLEELSSIPPEMLKNINVESLKEVIVDLLTDEIDERNQMLAELEADHAEEQETVEEAIDRAALEAQTEELEGLDNESLKQRIREQLLEQIRELEQQTEALDEEQPDRQEDETFAEAEPTADNQLKTEEEPENFSDLQQQKADTFAEADEAIKRIDLNQMRDDYTAPLRPNDRVVRNTPAVPAPRQNEFRPRSL